MSVPAVATVRPARQTIDTGLLAGKIGVPELPAWLVSRSRLADRLSQGARRRLTIVTGPAGAGKTVAIASFARTRADPGALAWMSADRYDNQPGTFWRHVTAALGQAGIAGPATTPAAGRQDGPAGQIFLSRLAGALTGHGLPVILVLDDAHLLTSQAVLDDIAYLMRRAGPALRLVLASRTIPQLPLHTFELSGDLTQIKAAELAFTVGEARQLISRHGVSIALSTVAALTRRTGGWAAGLRLAAAAMQAAPDPEQLASAFGTEGGELISGLVSDVLDSQPPGTRDLLLKTSMLDRVSDELAVELTGDEHAAARLATLADGNALVRPLGRGWYQYCPMLAQALQEKLRRRSPQEARELRRRAARWLGRRGQLTEAVGQAAGAADWSLAARTITGELAAGGLSEAGHLDTVAACLSALPEAADAADPAQLTVSAAIAVREQRPAEAAGLLGAAEETLGRLAGAADTPSRLALAQVRLALARQTGDLRSAAAATARASKLTAALPAVLLARHPELRQQVVADQARVEFWLGRLDEAAALLDSIGLGAADPSRPDPVQRADWVGLRALLAALSGQLADAAELAALASQLAAAQPRPARETGSAPEPRWAGEPQWTGEPQWAREPQWTGEPAGHLPSASAELALACVHLERGQLAALRDRLAGVHQVLRRRPDRLLSAVADLIAARQSIAAGDLAAATVRTSQASSGWVIPGWLPDRLRLTGEAGGRPGWQPRGSSQDGRDDVARPAGGGSVPVVIEALSGREREVLELMAGMLTTEEIAGELYLSVNTVKTHVRSILRKLGARRRGEAVRRARELGLLAASPRSVA